MTRAREGARARRGRRRRRDGPRRPSPLYEAARDGARRARRRSTRRSCSAPPRACTRPTGWSATRCSRPPGAPAARSARCASTPPRTSTAPSPASSSWSSSRRWSSARARSRRPRRSRRSTTCSRRVATPEQRAALEASALDDYVLGEERERERRRELVAARRRALARAVHPARGERARALGLRHRPLPDLPAEVQVRARLRDPAGADDQPALRDPDPPGARALPRRGAARGRRRAGEAVERRETGLDRLLALFEAGWRRAGFGSSDDELQYRDRAVAALTRYHERHIARRRRARSGSSAASTSRSARTSCAAASTASTASRRRLRADRLQDRRARAPRPSSCDDLQLALYRIGAREAWQIEAELGSYWYVLDDERVAGARPARRPRAGRAHRARGRRRDPGPGLRAQPSLRDLLLVRLPADLPGERGLGDARRFGSSSACRARAGAGTLEVLRDRVARRARRSRRRARIDVRPARPRAAATSSWISGLAATARSTCSSKRSIASSSSEASIAIAGQALEPAQQRQRRLRVRDRGHVVGDGRPEAGRGDPALAARVVEDADDPGRPLVVGAAEAEALDQLGVRGEAGDRHGAACGRRRRSARRA